MVAWLANATAAITRESNGKNPGYRSRGRHRHAAAQADEGLYPSIRWSDIRKPDDLAADEDFAVADLADLAAVKEIVAGVDGIVHLGGHSIEGPWETSQRQHYRLLQSFRGGLPRAGQTRGVRLLQSRDGLLPAQ